MVKLYGHVPYPPVSARHLCTNAWGGRDDRATVPCVAALRRAAGTGLFPLRRRYRPDAAVRRACQSSSGFIIAGPRGAIKLTDPALQEGRQAAPALRFAPPVRRLRAEVAVRLAAPGRGVEV